MIKIYLSIIHPNKKNNMKKLTSIPAISIFAIFISLSFFCSCSKPSTCADLSNPIDTSMVQTYVNNYYAIVDSNYHNAIGQITLTNDELYCLSKLSDKKLRLITAAKTTNVNDMMVIVQIADSSKYSYYSLDKMFPSDTTKHLCPPPTPCPIQ